MTARWANEATGKTCTKCGVHADAGRIFCANCGAALQSPVPLIPAAPKVYSRHFRTTSPTKGTIAKSILLGLPICLVLDILLGMVIPDQVMNVVLDVIVSILFLGALFVALGTVKKIRWGINTKPVNCPACGLRCQECGNRGH